MTESPTQPDLVRDMDNGHCVVLCEREAKVVTAAGCLVCLCIPVSHWLIFRLAQWRLRLPRDGRSTPIGPPRASRCWPECCRLGAMRLGSLTEAADYYRVDLGDSSARVLQSSISCQTKLLQRQLQCGQTPGRANGEVERHEKIKSVEIEAFLREI
ncbi:hypothetical protein PoB_004625800 [Plakobranchus ocellatus]|uniref:Uncharacterized protein n=1 Tax=Plakobranchus ocellatus TaxID=259542 RepID=A0AAV4BLQ3_9GAST|nr:hypothetical protein PoB_004625800 [Plakobranchus ocellatus]